MTEQAYTGMTLAAVHAHEGRRQMQEWQMQPKKAMQSLTHTESAKQEAL